MKDAGLTGAAWLGPLNLTYLLRYVNPDYFRQITRA
jgi:hypothetical protein